MNDATQEDQFTILINAKLNSDELYKAVAEALSGKFKRLDMAIVQYIDDLNGLLKRARDETDKATENLRGHAQHVATETDRVLSEEGKHVDAARKSGQRIVDAYVKELAAVRKSFMLEACVGEMSQDDCVRVSTALASRLVELNRQSKAGT
ncbi:MAG: hypothetical protein ACKV2Q_36415 [Planctomycetaceae bacterium]